MSGSEVYAGNILHVGSRARMSKVAAELASEAADLSFQAKEDSTTRSRSTTKSKITKRLGIENVK
ncbi:unnamed protein product, partial [Allacma fusca]